MNQGLDCEPNKILDSTNSACSELATEDPGIWRFPTISSHCCIYRVPHRLRRVNPEAYTPQLVLIGPLHHPTKYHARKSLGDITDTKSMGYLNMEELKKIYLEEFAKRVDGKETIDEFRREISKNEETIRESYSESTSWIHSLEFVEMILHDSVFIIEHMLRICAARSRTERTGDLIVDDPSLQTTVKEDLMLLENQLPYFILEKIFDPIVPRLTSSLTLRGLILWYFGFTSHMIRDETKFKHFTDLFRCIRVDTLNLKQTSNTGFRCLSDPSPLVGSHININYMLYNAEKLYSAGVEFEGVKNEFSIDVKFENGCLRIPSLLVCDNTEIILRNIMALEQSHYPSNAYVCNFVSFLDFLITNDKDVNLLFGKGVLDIRMHRSVVEMVNKLTLGVIVSDNYYSDIAYKVNAYFHNHLRRKRTILAAMFAGSFLLVLTLIQTVASVIQVFWK